MPAIGRPKVDAIIKKGGVFSFRVSAQEQAEIAKAAEINGKRATTWAREILLAKARETR